MNFRSPGRSWGNYPRTRQEVCQLEWPQDLPLAQLPPEKSILPYGLGRSYGDVCLNDGGILLCTQRMDRFLGFDPASGILRCQAGVSIADIIRFCLPRRWFVPVTPGTKYVTVGGAIANDVHGKNHGAAGTFGSHVKAFGLLRSDGSCLRCSPEENPELFCATIGGLGLTGLITWADIRLKRVKSRRIVAETIRFAKLDEFAAISAESEKDFDYTVAWIDCTAKGGNTGRGLFFRGNHSDDGILRARAHKRQLKVPIDFPSFVLNRHTISAFNALYYHLDGRRAVSRQVIDFEPFFYPLDRILDWNRMYGKRGFLQYQCVVPSANDLTPTRALLNTIAQAGAGSFLAVLKVFSGPRSPGLMSFPRPGITLALDFPINGSATFELLERLDAIVREAGGAVYPAKDARMSARSFEAFFPQWREFAPHVDPKFSSSFWRRVTRA